MQDLVGTTLILLAACSLAAVLTARLKVSTFLGHLVIGALLGASTTGWVMPGQTLSFLSGLAVALLLFMVGLEFSPGHFWLTRKTVLVAGVLQMAMIAIPMALTLIWLGHAPGIPALPGAAAAISSTALVSRQLADQGELTTRHGRSSFAVPVFQDLTSVPLLAPVAIWARGESPGLDSGVFGAAANTAFSEMRTNLASTDQPRSKPS